MELTRNNLYPVFNEILQRGDKERFLQQHSRVIWLTGLSGSGKTTIARNLERELFRRKFIAQVLDGDNIRAGINNNLGFSEEDRIENIRRIAEVSKLFLNCGIITINSFISPTEEIRKMAASIVGEENFIEIFISASLEVCEQRDTKGLYKRARKGEIKDFTGINAPFEIPPNPDLTIYTDKYSVEESISQVIEYILPLIIYNK